MVVLQNLQTSRPDVYGLVFSCGTVGACVRKNRLSFFGLLLRETDFGKFFGHLLPFDRSEHSDRNASDAHTDDRKFVSADHFFDLSDYFPKK